MPFTKKQERFFHARGIKHSHDYKNGRCECGQIEKVKKLKRGRYILTRVKKSKEHIRLGNKDILVS